MTTTTIAPTTQTQINPLNLCNEYHRVLTEVRKDVNTNRGEHTVTTEDIDGHKVYDMFYRTECYLVIESTNKTALKRLQSTYTANNTISDQFVINWISSSTNKYVFSMRLKSHIEIMDQQDFVVGYMKKKVKRYKKGLVSAMATLEKVANREYQPSYTLPKLSASEDHYHFSHSVAEWEKLQAMYSQLAKKLEICERFNPKHKPMFLTMWALDLVKLLDTSKSILHRRFDFTDLDRSIEQHIRWFLQCLVSDQPINPR